MMCVLHGVVHVQMETWSKSMLNEVKTSEYGMVILEKIHDDNDIYYYYYCFR